MIKLTTGSQAPDFQLQDQDGKMVKLQDFKGSKLLVYFYPRASTPGCTVQACSVRDHKEALGALGVARIGISPDKPDSQKKFEAQQALNFSLLCDEDHATAEAYGAWGEKTMFGKTTMGIIRSSFLIDEKGYILDAWYKVKPEATVPNVLDLLHAK